MSTRMDCPECSDQAEAAAARASATPAESEGLQLGECTGAYRAWAECIERESGQAKRCAAVLKEFRECHTTRTARPR